ncbi:MAG: EscU/YscU/HrcU family type III secretion system export apparatus switch protein [Peptostreptococcaceae bacterium]|nr:EscU/YscU/HrcU family type III secretion system export apparatus switch protein [Criibacterium bergeronii]MBS6062571.1 EscU/YscU/HrcU family type III secretion system export apparatus switch protein [Peptostreptococcaceae bacterium]
MANYKNNIKKAVALEYNEKMSAPIVNAKGQGYVAENMLEKAKQSGIKEYIDEDLLKDLMALSIGDEIPVELYEIVAKVLKYVETVDKNNGRK